MSPESIFRRSARLTCRGIAWTGLTAGALAIAILSLAGCSKNSHNDPTPHGPAEDLWVVNPDGSGDFVTISAAIAAAGEGDTIAVAAATYTEALEVTGKTLVLVGAGADQTIVQYDGSQTAGRVFSIRDGAEVEVYGFRFVQLYIACGAGLRVEDSQALIADCALKRCGLLAAGADLVLRGCTLYEIPPMSCDMIVPIVELLGGTVQVERSIIASAHTGVSCGNQAQVTFACNDVFCLHTNYTGCPDPTGTGGNISEDPAFVDPSAGDFHLLPTSPCIAGHTAGCGQMGAFGSR